MGSEMCIRDRDGTTSYEFEKIVRQRSGDKLEGVTLRVAVNQEYVKDDTELYDGDEVVLIPPVQGG